MKKILKKVVSTILVLALVIVSITTREAKLVQAATSSKELNSTYLNATEKYLSVGETNATFNFNIKKSAQKDKSTYSWYVKSDKGNPKAVAINKKTGVVTAKEEGTAYIRCKITLANGTIIRPEAKVVVSNNITAVTINNVPKDMTVELCKETDFNRTIVKTAAGKGKTTHGVTRWEITEDTAGVISASSSGVVFPTKVGSFKIRAICFENAVKYKLWLEDRTKNANYITASSEWFTIKVVSTEGVAIAKTQAQFEKALTAKNISEIQLTTNQKIKFTIPAGDYLDKNLIVDAPNADVDNYGTFKKIIIKAIKDTTWIEYANGNIVYLSDSVLSIVVDSNADIKQIVIDTPNSQVNLLIEGNVEKVTVLQPSQVTVSGSAQNIPVVVEETAIGSNLTSSIPLNLSLNADTNVVLEQGAEGTKLDKGEGSVEVKLNNNTQQSVTITTNNQGGETIGSGQSAVSNENTSSTPPPAPPTPPTPAKGTIVQKAIPGGSDLTATVNGQTITFDGNIPFVFPDEINNFPISGNWVGTKITAPEGVIPDENAALIYKGQEIGKGWNDFKDGDNYFYFYRRVFKITDVYQLDVKWNNSVTETYSITLAPTAKLEVYKVNLDNAIKEAQNAYDNADYFGVISEEAKQALLDGINVAKQVYNNTAAIQGDIDTATESLYAVEKTFFDIYVPEILADSRNLEAGMTYTDTNPLVIHVRVEGIGTFDSSRTDYFTFGGALSGMTLKSATFEEDEYGAPSMARLEVIGTVGDTINGTISIVAGGINEHNHGFTNVTVLKKENIQEVAIPGGVNLSHTINGHSITFDGEIPFYYPDEYNTLPQGGEGNWVGIRIYAPEGVMPDENAVLTYNGNILGEGWENIGEGDYYFHIYKRVRNIDDIYTIEIKWNNDLTETYTINFADTTTFIVDRTDLQDVLYYSQLNYDNSQAGYYGEVTPEVLETFHNAIIDAQAICDSQSSTYIQINQAITNLDNAQIEFFDTFDYNITATTENMQAGKLYTEADPLIISVTIDGIGEFNAEDTGYFTLGGNLSDMSILDTSFEWNEYSAFRAILKLTGTVADTSESGTISIASGGVYMHSHGFENIQVEQLQADRTGLLEVLTYTQQNYDYAIAGDYGTANTEALEIFHNAIIDAQAIYDSPTATQLEIDNAIVDLDNAQLEFLDTFDPNITATSENLEIGKLYTEADPLIISVQVEGMGDFNIENTGYFTLGGNLSSMSILDTSFETNEYSTFKAILSLTGTVANTPESGTISIAAGGVNLHNHDFIDIIVGIVPNQGMIEQAILPDGADLMNTVSGQSITFEGVIPYIFSTENNYLPEDGNWVGIKVTVPEGIIPDENAELNVGGDIWTGWDNIKSGDNYFNLYVKMYSISDVYQVDIKWNNDFSETYFVNLAPTAILEISKSNLEGTIAGAQTDYDNAANYGNISAEALQTFSDAIQIAQGVCDNPEATQEEIDYAEYSLWEAIASYRDTFIPAITATSNNMVTGYLYTNTDPLYITIEVSGMGDFNTNIANWLVLNDSFVGMTYNTITYELNEYGLSNKATIQLTGVLGSAELVSSISILPGAINNHSHGFEFIPVQNTLLN